MPLTVELSLQPHQAADQAYYIPAAAKRAGVPEKRIALARIVKRSVDARGGGVKVNLTLELFVDGEKEPEPVGFDYPDVSRGKEVIIVGGGPAGLFAALRLIEHGYCPLIVERGKEVSERKRDIAELNRNGELNPDSNYAFGEGGAGTFSDGKLFTRSKKRGDYNRALQILVFHGASPEILYDAHPHIGTDRLPAVMTAIRKTITDAGGRFLFNRRVTDIIIKDGTVRGVVIAPAWSEKAAEGTPEGELIDGSAVVLATGHSASDIYEMLDRRGVLLEPKPFAMGVRVEHPQEMIDHIQYHGAGREHLPAASYSLTAQAHGRGVYSFCMCPGGFIVPALTDPAGSVVNGMSPSGRNSRWANSGIVTEVRLHDFRDLQPEYGALAGLEFRRRFEHAARIHGGRRQVAPAQRLPDFLSERESKTLPETSYVPGLTTSRFHEWMPGFMIPVLQQGFKVFDRRMRGFITPDAQIVGVESRTSSPVRIPRDQDTLMHPVVKGLYPCAEGAGYAGGIISAAMDGERIADAIAARK